MSVKKNQYYLFSQVEVIENMIFKLNLDRYMYFEYTNSNLQYLSHIYLELFLKCRSKKSLLQKS